MHPRLLLQLHVHSERSHDSRVSIKDYVRYLNKNLRKNEFAVLGITDHNVVPIKIEDALRYSTGRVIVIPGIQWKLHKSIAEAVEKLATRREILTLGDHDDLQEYIRKKTDYSVMENDEIDGNFREDELLEYLSHEKNLMIVVPHPKHFIVDYYGKNEIKDIRKKIEKNMIALPFFIEDKTGYDPFPRILYDYDREYNVVGGSDAHEIHSILGTDSFFSVETELDFDEAIAGNLEKDIQSKDLNMYRRVIHQIFTLLKNRNNDITIKKHYFRSNIQFLGSIPRFFHRRLENFPYNLFR